MKNRFLILFLMLSSVASAQNFNVQSAADAFKDLKFTKNRFKDFSDAKKYIDLAAENEQTANDPKMWYYRGVIYLEMDRDTNETVRSLDENAIEKSAVSFMNCLKADTKKNYEEECNADLWVAGLRLFNKAVAALNKGDFDKASRYFNLTQAIIPLDKDNNLKRNTITPDVINYNLARAAMKAKDNARAKEYLQKLIDVKYNDPNIYMYIDRIYLGEMDTAKALSYIEQGRKIFDENTSLLNEEIMIYSRQGKIDALIAKFSDAISLNDGNEVLYFNRASLYDNKGDFANAETDYKKAIELKPDYLDANYWLGNLYFRQAAAIIKAAGTKSNDEFERSKKESEKFFKNAAPYFEKANELNPKKTDDDKTLYKETLTSLKQLYVRIGEMDNYNRVKALLEQSQ
jgi:tetratricopeptide (TPR) repeat protein